MFTKRQIADQKALKKLDQSGVELKKLAHSTATANAMLTVLAMRNRDSGETDIERFRILLKQEGFNDINETHYMETWKELQKLGFGALIIGNRKGERERFVWNYCIPTIAKGAFSVQERENMESPKVEAKKEAPVLKVKRKYVRRVQESVKATVQENWVSLVIQTSDGEQFIVKAPHKITMKDAQRISHGLMQVAKSA